MPGPARARRGRADWSTLPPDLHDEIVNRASPLALGALAHACKSLRDKVKEINGSTHNVDRFALAAAQAGMPADCVASGLNAPVSGWVTDKSTSFLHRILLTLNSNGELCSMTVAEIMEGCHKYWRYWHMSQSDSASPGMLGAVEMLGEYEGSMYCVALVKVVLGARGGSLIRGVFSVDLQLPAGLSGMKGCVLWALDGPGNLFHKLVSRGIFRWRPSWNARSVGGHLRHQCPCLTRLCVQKFGDAVAIPLMNELANFCHGEPNDRFFSSLEWLTGSGGWCSVPSFGAFISASVRVQLPTPRSLYCLASDPRYVSGLNDFVPLETLLKPIWPAALCLHLLRSPDGFLEKEANELGTRMPPFDMPLAGRKKRMWISTAPKASMRTHRWLPHHELKRLRALAAAVGRFPFEVGQDSDNETRLHDLRVLLQKDHEEVSVEQIQHAMLLACGLKFD